MNNGNIVVACVTLGAAASPYCAYQTRPPALFFDSSLEDWLVSALKGGDGSQRFWLVAIACAIVGLVVGLLLKRGISPAKDSGADLAPLRTPIAAAIFIPVGIATILLVSCNHTVQILENVVWPEFYSKNWMWCSVSVAIVGFIVAKLFNTWERAFAQAPLLVQMATICCSPFAACVGLVVMAGFIGSGLLGGFAVGRFYGCPITGAWMGTCLAVFALAFGGRIFWPSYFPVAAPQGNE